MGPYVARATGGDHRLAATAGGPARQPLLLLKQTAGASRTGREAPRSPATSAPRNATSTVLASLLSAQPAAAASAVEDAHCDGPVDTAIFTSQRWAQTFTAEHTGELTRAQLDESGLPAIGGQDFVIDIRTVDAAGTPTNTVLASAAVNNVSVATFAAATAVTADFNPGVPVVAGHKYAAVITRTGGSGLVGIAGKSPSSCPGEAFSDPT
jgi:hypothetical protein